jgi:lysosomal alpha-mannosidase
MKYSKYLILSILLVVNTSLKPLTVHIVPHSHDDAGWLWTMEEYFEGKGDCPYRVKSILDNFVVSLSKTKKLERERTFIYVEMAFFIKWYKEQEPKTKDKVKKLIRREKFEFINGGYVMHDEASTYYQHIIDQMRLGLLFLKEEFNHTPKIAWFIDPFGHSAATAYILSKMGFDKIAFVRIDQKEKNIRIAQKNLEFYWFPFDQVDNTAKIFTHVTYEHYCPPHSLRVFIDDELLELSEERVAEISKNLYNDVKKWNSGFKHDHLMLMYGCDFSFNKADYNYKNIERIMKYFKKNYKGDMALKYSTPTKYFEKVLTTKNIKWSEYKNYDFFPYAENPYSYWTGYFTSRPFLKGFVRETGNYLTTSSKFIVEHMLKNAAKFTKASKIDRAITRLYDLRANLAICQHHDAVSGTAKEKVSEDYITLLAGSIKGIKKSLGEVIKEITSTSYEIKSCVTRDSFNACTELLKIETEILVNIFNPGLNGDNIIHFNLPYGDVNFYTYPDNVVIPTDSYCINDKDFTDVNKCIISVKLTFDKSQQFYKVKLRREANNFNLEDLKEMNTIVDTEKIKLEFQISNDTFVVNMSGQKPYTFTLNHAFYNAYEGYGSTIKPDGVNPDGAYVLSTKEEKPTNYILHHSQSHIIRGKNFTQLTLRYQYSRIIIRPMIINKKLILEIETIWDSFKQHDSGTEYLLHITSDINNTVKLPNNKIQPEWWTDSNGLKLMRRIKDFRGGYNYKVTEKVASNFYPVNTIISLRDTNSHKYSTNDYEGLFKDDRVISVFTDRSESAGAMDKGEVMLILNRNSNRDDWKGLEEALFEEASAKNFRVTHWMTFGADAQTDWLRNYIQNRVAVFRTDSQLPKESLVDKFVTHTENLDINFHVLNKKEFFLQAINTSDKYFSNGSKGLLTFKVINEFKYSVYEWKFSGAFALKKLFFKKLSYVSVDIGPQGMKLFKVKLL